jgi:MFS family permease
MGLIAATNGLSNRHHWLILLAVLAFWVGQSLFAGWIADFKGRRFVVYAIAALIVGPLVLLIALLLPRPRRSESEASAQSPGKLAPRWKRFTGLDG